MSSAMRASRLSGILIVALVALMLVLIAGSAFAANAIMKKSTTATHSQIDAEVSEDDPSRLEALKQYLANNAEGISQTQALTAGLGQYNQNTIVATINGYASKAGVSITSFDFGTTSASGAAATSSANTVNLQVSSPVRYQNFIIFLQLIEHGLMPATITNAQISSNSTEPGTVTISALTVKVAG